MANEYVINKGINVISTLIRTYNLQNVRVPDARDQQYTTQIGVTQDETRPSKMANMGSVPVFVDLKLLGGNYIDNLTGKNVSFADITIDTVLITVQLSMNIIKTAIQGRDGTVKEYIGKDDAKVTIQGVICGANGVYPKEEVSALLQWINAPISKGVTCGYLQNLGIDNLVVEDATIPQIAGGYSYQTFTINCISDLPVELTIA